MDIYGFKTENLLEALTIKARKDTKKWDVVDEIPDLLERLHNEMANNDHSVC